MYSRSFPIGGSNKNVNIVKQFRNDKFVIKTQPVPFYWLCGVHYYRSSYFQAGRAPRRKPKVRDCEDGAY